MVGGKLIELFIDLGVALFDFLSEGRAGLVDLHGEDVHALLIRRHGIHGPFIFEDILDEGDFVGAIFGQVGEVVFVVLHEAHNLLVKVFLVVVEVNNFLALVHGVLTQLAVCDDEAEELLRVVLGVPFVTHQGDGIVQHFGQGEGAALGKV